MLSVIIYLNIVRSHFSLKMKICHVNMFYLPTFGGVEQVMYELAKRQVADGHEVHVYCCDNDKNNVIDVKEEIIEGIKVHRLPYWFRLSLSTFIWPSLLWKFNNEFDIVHSHVSGHLYVLIIGLLSRLKKFKHVHTTHCPWTDSSFRPLVLQPFLFLNNLILNKLAFEMIDTIVAITPWELDIINSYVDEHEKEKIKVIQNGTDGILFKKIKDNNFVWLIGQIINVKTGGGDSKIGMPLGNYTSQFFANVYLIELDYFIKYKLKIKYYIRYVDDFVILHNYKLILEFYKQEINNFLKDNLKIELHEDKSKIIPLHKGIKFLGFRNFYYYKLLKKSNVSQFKTNLRLWQKILEDCNLDKEKLKARIQGWMAHANRGNSYNLIKNLNLKSFLKY